MQILRHFIYVSWASSDFGIFGGLGTIPPGYGGTILYKLRPAKNWQLHVLCQLHVHVHGAFFPDQGKRGGGGKWILGTFMSWVSLKSSPF